MARGNESKIEVEIIRKLISFKNELQQSNQFINAAAKEKVISAVEFVHLPLRFCAVALSVLRRVKCGDCSL